MAAIDVHMLVMPSNRADWREQALASIVDAANRVDSAIELHLAPAVPGHMGKARAAAYALGDAPLVTFVDEDDWLEPDAFVAVLAALDGRVGNVLTAGRVHHLATGQSTLTARGLLVVKRELALAFPWDDYPLCGTCDLRDAVRPDLLSVAVYNRRDHQSSGRALFASQGASTCRG